MTRCAASSRDVRLLALIQIKNSMGWEIAKQYMHSGQADFALMTISQDARWLRNMKCCPRLGEGKGQGDGTVARFWAET